MAGERILVVDDSPQILNLCNEALTKQGYAVQVAGDGRKAIAQLEVELFDLLLVDIQMPEVTGLEVLRRGLELDPNLTVVIMSGYATLKSAIETLNLGARGFLVKPFGLRDLNTVLEQALAQRQREQERLRLQAQLPILEIGQTSVANGDVENLAIRLLEVVTQYMKAGKSVLMLLNEAASELYVAHAIGMAVAPTKMSIPLNQSFAGQALLQDESLVLDSQSQAIADLPWQSPTAKSDITVVYVPLRTRNKMVGVVGLSRERNARPNVTLSPTELSILSTIGSQMATVLENTFLYNDIRTATEQLETLRQVSQDLVTLRDLDQLLQRIVEYAIKLLNVDGGGMYLYYPERQVLEWALRIGDRLPSPGLTLSPGEGLGGQVWSTRQPLYVDDYGRWPGRSTQRSEFRKLASMLAVPVQWREDFLGVLVLHSGQPGHPFSPQNVELLSQFATYAAIALQNARLYTAAQQEIEERKHTEKALETSERKWRAAFDQNFQMAALLDLDGRILAINKSASSFFGMAEKELMGKPFPQAYRWSEEAQQKFEEAIRQAAQGEVVHFEATNQNALGDDRDIDYSVNPVKDDGGRIIYIIAEGRDITEYKRMQSSLVQSDKLAALGRLSASLAHEMNNPLQALYSGLGLLVGRSLDEQKQQRYLKIANQQVERLIAITEQMLNPYRPSTARWSLVDINQTLDEILTLSAKKLQHSHVTVSRKLADHLPQVKASADDLKHVFLNIILNAIDAMPKGGQLDIETGWDVGVQELSISFTDTGHGIPAREMSHIFEPFYTTRTEGTGLGLAISYNIVEHHGGRIEVESQVGVGSTFTVLLPVAQGSMNSWPEESA